MVYYLFPPLSGTDSLVLVVCTNTAYLMTACVGAQLLCCAQLCSTPWTVARQAPLFMGFSRREYWNGSHALLQGIFPTQGLSCISCVFCTVRWILYLAVT